MKRIVFILLFLTLLTLLSTGCLYAAIKLPAVFGNNMVLQQQMEVAIWGKANPKANVRIITSWNKKSYSTIAGVDGNWKIKVSTPAAGGPYEITITDGKSIKLQNVLIGEVWICSGQSNMVMPMRGYFNEPVANSNEVIATAANPLIRFFTVNEALSLKPMCDLTGSWMNCNSETVSKFSATAYYFGLMLYRALNVPVGLINTSWGGTRIEPWISENGLKKFDWASIPENVQQENISPATPTVLFNAMINPLSGYGIRGVIWYQGESNRNEPDKYLQLLPALADDWRSVWGFGEFPFYYVQIAPFDYGPASLNSAYLREAQMKAAKAGTNMGMACIMDVGERDNIHPADKITTGNRLAFLALARTYELKGFACTGPELKEMKIEGNQVKLTFDNAANGLTSFGKELSCFEVAGANKCFFPAKAFITSTGITIYSVFVSTPVAVRYAFQDFITGDLYNTEGIPASSFRTDDW
jgi:sialate O-acetylesterase